MKHSAWSTRRSSLSVLTCALLHMAACGGGSTSAGPKTLSSIAITAASSSIGIGAGDQFTATGTYSDNSHGDLTTSATWTSSNPATAPISPVGLATAVAVGKTNITAKSGTVTSPLFSLTVIPPTLVSIFIEGDESLKVGAMGQFVAGGYYSDSSEKFPLAGVIWSSSNPGTATISTAGVATAKAVGTTNIAASSGSVISPAIPLAVPSIKSIAIMPNRATLMPQQTQQFVATGTYSDSTTGDITSCATWTSSNPATATISSAGLATANAVGTTNITARSGTVTSPLAQLTVSSTAPPQPSELLYATTNNAILGFTVDPASGVLSSPTYTPGPILPCGAPASPYQGIVSLPKLGFLYVSDGENNEAGGGTFGSAVFRNQVDGFAISTAAGTLTPLSGSPFSLPPSQPFALPGGMAVDPQGRFLYVSNFDADADDLSIDNTTGALTAISALSVPFGFNPSITVHPSGNFLYGDAAASVSGVTVDTSTGALTVLADSPFLLPCQTCSFEPLLASSMLVDATGGFLYVIGYATQEAGQPTISFIAGYTIDATTGALSSYVPGLPSFGSAPHSGLSGGIATIGTFLYVDNPQG